MGIVNFLGIVLTIGFLFDCGVITAHGADESLIVQIPQGKLLGRASLSRNGREFYEFLGIPYAKPPVRFEAPEKPVGWNGTRNARKYAEPCIHYHIGPDDIEIVNGKEDCLYLNVHTPTLEDAKLPVMVYIRDGFFQIPGRGNEYGFQYFMDENVVLVEFAYRLGAFGFLCTGDGLIQGNMGLKDQVMALHWVQENIRFFGGDETEVTIFGVDAGAASVSFHILSPMSEGLFNKAIAQSGSALSSWALTYVPQDYADRFAEELDCHSKFRSEMVECLKQKDASELVALDMKKWYNDPMVDFMPVIERIPEGMEKKSEIFLPDCPIKMYRDGLFKKVPLIIGVTSHNGLMHHALGIIRQEDVLAKMNHQKYFKDIASITFYYDGIVPYDEFMDVSEAIKDFYFGEQEIGFFTIDNLTNAYSDRLFNQGVRNAAMYHAQHAPVYPYVFAYNPDIIPFDYSESPFHFDVGAEHGKDIDYMFTLMNSQIGNDGIYAKGSEKDTFMKSFIRLWVSFAKTGKPSKLWGSTKKWPAISSKNLQNKSPVEWLRITEDPHLVQDPFAERVEFWNYLLESYYKIFEDVELKGFDRVALDVIEDEANISPAVRLSVGTVVGVTVESRNGKYLFAYFGIPYAKKPERFEPATEFAHWEGLRNVTEYASDCMQLEFNIDPDKMTNVIGSEDCLYLNIFMPKEVDIMEVYRPVLVIFRDYAFAHGSSRGLGGHYFVDEGVVVVTVNYRLGALGYLNTGDGVANGNLGLKDQNFALEWIQEHIRGFLGDPTKVTVMGFGSGGAASVTYHVLSPMSKGLFHRAIAHSGSALCPWAFIQEPRQAAVGLAERLDCPTYDSKNMLNCLKSKNAKDIVKQKFYRFFRDPMTTFGPSIEIISSVEDQKYSTFLDEHPLSLWRSGRINQVPMIIGSMSMETINLYSYGNLGGYYSTYQEELEDEWETLLPIILYYEKSAAPKQVEKISQIIKKFYVDDDFEVHAKTPILVNYTQMLTHRLFHHGIKQAAKLHAKFAPVYPFQFLYHRDDLGQEGNEHPSQNLWGFGHEDDMEFFLYLDIYASSLSDSIYIVDRNPEPGSPEERFSINIVKLWSSFIRTGKPSVMYRADYEIAQNSPPTEWHPIQPQNLGKNPAKPIDWFGASPTPFMSSEPFKKEMEFWDSVVQMFDNDLLVQNGDDNEDFSGDGISMKDEL